MACSNISSIDAKELKGFTGCWRIENFYWSSDAIPVSPDFRIDTIGLKFNIYLEECEDGLGVFLGKITKYDEITLDLSLSVLTNSGWETILKNLRREFTDKNANWGWKICSWKQLLSQNKFYILNGALTILMNVRNGELDKNEKTLRLMVSEMPKELWESYRDNLKTIKIENFSTLRGREYLPFPSKFEFPFDSTVKSEEVKPKEVKDQLTQTDNVDFKNAFPTDVNFDSDDACQTDANIVPEDASQTAVNFDSKDACQTDANIVPEDASQTAVNFDFKDMADLLKLFEEKKFTFVTLRTADRDFSVHKAVLIAKSPVFSAMFDKEMKENNSNLVCIDDIDSQTMATFVNFLHFEPLGDLDWECGVKLYYAANKYQIDALKNECVSLLRRVLSVENVCDVFILADLHQDKDLMSCAMEYFCKNSKVIFPSKKWKDLIFSHPELTSEVLCKLSEKM